MVFRKEMLVVIISVTAVLWIQTTSMGPSDKVMKKKMAKEGKKEEEMLCQCYDEMNCEKGDEFYQIFDNECYKKTIKQDVELISKFVSDGGYKTEATSFREFLDFFCKHDKETKKKIFEVGSNKLVAHTSDICQKNGNGDECKRLQAFLTCVGNLIKKHNEAGDCGK